MADTRGVAVGIAFAGTILFVVDVSNVELIAPCSYFNPVQLGIGLPPLLFATKDRIFSSFIGDGHTCATE